MKVLKMEILVSSKSVNCRVFFEEDEGRPTLLSSVTLYCVSFLLGFLFDETLSDWMTPKRFGVYYISFPLEVEVGVDWKDRLVPHHHHPLYSS